MRYLDDLPIVKTRRRKKAKSCIKKGQRNKHASPSRYAYYITEKGLLQMTNEEIAVRIQQGETGLYSLLWERVEKLVTLLAGRYYARSQVICARSGLELEDLIQAGYFAMLDTVPQARQIGMNNYWSSTPEPDPAYPHYGITYDLYGDRYADSNKSDSCLVRFMLRVKLDK